MPEKATIERARKDKRQGKAASTQAGEFVREEIHHVREGKHGAKNTKQAIAIGLSKARKAGVKLPARGQAKNKKRSTSKRGSASPKRARAAKKALRRQPRSSASPRALSQHAKAAARRRSKADRSRAARKAARTRKRRGT
jgi:hypothetical protein